MSIVNHQLSEASVQEASQDFLSGSRINILTRREGLHGRDHTSA